MLTKKIFLSYSRHDVEFVTRLHADLVSKGFSLWRDVTDIRANEEWSKAINEGLKSTEVMLVVVSQASSESDEVFREWSYFLSRKKPIICVWIEDSSVNYRLEPQQRILFTNMATYEDALSKLVFEVSLLTDHTVTSVVNPPVGRISGVFNENVVQDQDTVNWTNVIFRCNQITKETLEVRYIDKFDQNYYAQRSDIKQHFVNFLASEATVMVITGKAGTGKSSFVCSIVQEFGIKYGILLIDCAYLNINPDESINDYLASLLDLKDHSLLELASGEIAPLIIVFDAVNEYKQRELLLGMLSDFIRNVKSKYIKILVTSRTPIWQTIRKHFTVPIDKDYHTGGPNSYVTIDKFTHQEIESAYDLYRTIYQIKTPFSKLSTQVSRFIQQPLFLKLTSEAYEGLELPHTLVLKDVFTKYIEKCLGDSGFEGVEYLVLSRAIELMHANAQRELNRNVLESDEFVSQHILTPTYLRLVDIGLLSEKAVEASILKRVAKVFVTYERVFEFLLAEIAVGAITSESIRSQLDLAREKSFIQLRGALELAVGFSIVQGQTDFNLLLELAKQNLPDTRQFLVDVINVIYDTGNQDLVNKILGKLISSTDSFAKLLAIQSSYQLKLDDELVKAVLSGDELLRDTASVYLYLRWNTARLDGNLVNAYIPIHKIITSINLMRPQRSKRSLEALFSLSIMIIPKIIEDRASVLPLLDIMKNMVDRIPGISLGSGQGIPVILNTLIDVLTFVVTSVARSPIQNSSSFMDEKSMEKFFHDKESQRIFMDASLLLDNEDLVGHEEILHLLIMWEHSNVRWIARMPMLYHVTRNPDVHQPIMVSLFNDERISLDGKISIGWAITYGLVGRILRGLIVTNEHLNVLKDMFIELWYLMNELDVDYKGEGLEDGFKGKFDALKNQLYGIMIIEINQQNSDGGIKGSDFLLELLSLPEMTYEAYKIEMILSVLERTAYHGYPEFAVRSILNNKFRSIWESSCYSQAVKSLANIRVFYQEEIDDILISDEDYQVFWNSVRLNSSVPNNEDVIYPASNGWPVATASEWAFMKTEGLIVFQMCLASSVNDFMRRFVKILASSLINFDIINLSMLHWLKSHDPSWNNYEKWEIPESLKDDQINKRVIASYISEIDEFIAKRGKGILFTTNND